MNILKKIKTNVLLSLILSSPLQAAEQFILDPTSSLSVITTSAMEVEEEPFDDTIQPFLGIPIPSSTFWSLPSIDQAFHKIFLLTSYYQVNRIGLSLDLDDTLIHSEERLWRHYLHAHKANPKSEIDLAVLRAANNLHRSFACDIKNSLFCWLREQKKFQLLSSKIPLLIHEAMTKGITVFINTARPSTEDSRHFTQQQLLSFTNLNNGRASQSSLTQFHNLPLSVSRIKDPSAPPQNAYFDEQNVLYTSGMLKGRILNAYLTKRDLKFDVLFHIDDQRQQSISMYSAFFRKNAIHSLLVESEKTSLFSSVSSLNHYINKQLRKRLPFYPTQEIDWTQNTYVETDTPGTTTPTPLIIPSAPFSRLKK